MLSASLDGFPGDILHVDARGHQATEPGAVLIRASAGGEDVFELKVCEAPREILLSKAYTPGVAHLVRRG